MMSAYNSKADTSHLFRHVYFPGSCERCTLANKNVELSDR